MGENICVLGCGAVGLALSAFLASEGKNVLAVRTSENAIAAGKINVTVNVPGSVLRIPIQTTSLSALPKLNGIAVVTAKAHANRAIASALLAKDFHGPIALMQNGLGVEEPFVEAGFGQIFRCVLYLTSEVSGTNEVRFRTVASSPLGQVKGSESSQIARVEALSTGHFPLHLESFIEKEVWKKTIINSVFNSICPLLNVDNGIFARDETVAALAREIVEECLALAAMRNLPLSLHEIMEQILRISKNSDGMLISTLQDIRKGRETEIEFLNLALARIASLAKPPVALDKTRLLGKMIETMQRLKCPPHFS